jgi:hypothetical protein
MFFAFFGCGFVVDAEGVLCRETEKGICGHVSGRVRLGEGRG